MSIDDAHYREILACIADCLTPEDVAQVERQGRAFVEAIGMEVTDAELKDMDRLLPGWRDRLGTDHPAPARLPFWDDAWRGCPSPLLRSALFGVFERNGGRRVYENELIESVEGVEIRYTGIQLGQDDLDVCLFCFHLYRAQSPFVRIVITERDFLVGVGRCTGGSDRRWLRGCLRRLQATGLEISWTLRNRTVAYAGSLIDEYAYDSGTGKYAIRINPKIAALFANGCWSGLDFQVRRQLGRDSLARWLHAFYSSHKAPLPYRIETLHRLSNSRMKHLRSFRARIRKSAARLAAAADWDVRIDDRDRLVVDKKPTQRGD